MRTRAEDGNRWARMRTRWSKWGDLIKGVSGIVACVGCLILAILMFRGNQEQTRDQRAVRAIAQEQLRITQAESTRAKRTAQLTRDQCIRSKALGPSFYEDYAVRKVLSPEKLALYRSLIPTSCPK